MVLHGLLPKPLPSDDIVVGMLLSHPLHPERDGFYSQQAHEVVDELNDYHIQLRYKDVIAADQEGRFMSSYGSKYELGRIYRQPNLLTVTAEQMIQRTSQRPRDAFDAVCNDPEAQQWIYNLAKQQQDFYVVVGITELHKAVFKRAKLRDAGASRSLAEAPLDKDARVPRALSRRNSTLGGLGSEPSISGVFGMDIRRCTARISSAAEPHRLEDIGFHWSYYDVPNSANKEQLIVGLGDPLKANELRLMLDLSEETVQGNLDAISQLSLDAVSVAASPLLKPSSPALRGRSPSPHPQLKGTA